MPIPADAGTHDRHTSGAASLATPPRPGRRRATIYVGLGAAAVALVALLLMPRGGDPVTVPDVSGMNVSAATARLEKAGLHHREVRTDDPTAREDVDVSQTPPGGTERRTR